jgi:hypothetical protein
MADRMGELFRDDTYTPPWWRDRYAPSPLAIDAGIKDIGRRYGPPGEVQIDPILDRIEASEGVRGIAGMARPERFSDALMRMPMSQNIEYVAPASPEDLARAMVKAQQNRNRRMQP